MHHLSARDWQRVPIGEVLFQMVRDPVSNRREAAFCLLIGDAGRGDTDLDLPSKHLLSGCGGLRSAV